MDTEKALEFVKRGATLLLLDVPQYTLVGIDTQMFTVGPAFMGIKMIPPGPHFVYYSSTSRDGREFSPIIGFFVDVGPSEVIVRKWCQQDERLVKVPEEEEERFCQAVKCLEFDRHLGPYNLSQYGEWRNLSNYITKDVIERIEPIGGEITVACESEVVKSNSKSAMERALDDQFRASKFSTSSSVGNSSKVCYYTAIPRLIKHKGMNREELTSLNLDKTKLLESILMKDYGGSEDLLLGEVQFAYIAFLMGQSLEAFLQWKVLISLFFSCVEAPFSTRSFLFVKFVKVIYYQLKYGLQRDEAKTNCAAVGVSSLLDESSFSADSFLYQLCKDFFPLVLEASVVNGDLLLWTRKLKELLVNSLGWEFRDDGEYLEEDDEFAPAVEVFDQQSIIEG